MFPEYLALHLKSISLVHTAEMMETCYELSLGSPRDHLDPSYGMEEAVSLRALGWYPKL